MNNLYQTILTELKRNSDDLEFEKLGEYYAENNELVFSQGEKKWKLTSNNSMDIPIRIWCEQFHEVKYNTVFAIFGLGYVGYLLELSRLFPDNLIIIYEPDETILFKQMRVPQMLELVHRKNIYWIIGKNRKAILCKTMDERMDYTNGVDIVYGCIPNYKKVFEEEWKFFCEQIHVAKMYMNVSRNTRIVSEEKRGKCILYNIEDLAGQADVLNLIAAFKDINVSQYPAIVVAAGPSLDKNIEELCPYQDQVFIICVDSAIRTVLKYGIVPDLLVCVDPIKNPDLFANEYGKNIPLITHLCCNYKITKICGGRKFYSSDGEEYIKRIYSKYGKQAGMLPTGGTVANNAFSLLRLIGFETIILIGQDLAYPGKQLHTAEANAEYELDEEDNKYFYVEGIDGKPVLSETNMTLYKKWYEEQVEKFPNIKIIDATEGGALIKGTEIMTLKAALKQNCNGRKKDFYKVIQNAEYLLTPEEQEDMRQSYATTIERIPAIIYELQGQLQVYDELDKLNRQGKYHTKQFTKAIEKVSAFNRKMDHDMTIALLQIYANQGDYAVQDKLQTKSESKYEEIKLLIEVGRQLIETYVEAGEKLLSAWKEINEFEQ